MTDYKPNGPFRVVPRNSKDIPDITGENIPEVVYEVVLDVGVENDGVAVFPKRYYYNRSDAEEVMNSRNMKH